MEKPPPPERVATLGGNNVQRPVRDGVRMDGQWKCQPVHQGAQGCESIRACRFSFLLLTSLIFIVV